MNILQSIILLMIGYSIGSFVGMCDFHKIIKSYQETIDDYQKTINGYKDLVNLYKGRYRDIN